METNEEFRELKPLENIVIPNSLRKQMGIDEKEELHIQVRNDNEKTITLKIEKMRKGLLIATQTADRILLFRYWSNAPVYFFCFIFSIA